MLTSAVADQLHFDDASYKVDDRYRSAERAVQCCVTLISPLFRLQLVGGVARIAVEQLLFRAKAAASAPSTRNGLSLLGAFYPFSTSAACRPLRPAQPVCPLHMPCWLPLCSLAYPTSTIPLCLPAAHWLRRPPRSAHDSSSLSSTLFRSSAPTVADYRLGGYGATVSFSTAI